MGMTTAQLIDELKRSLGNRTDISDERYVRWLNWALLDIAGYHKKRMYKAKRFHELEGIKTLEIPVHSGTASASTDTTVSISGATIDISLDYYNDWVILVNGEEHIVSDWDGSAITIPDTWDTNPESGDSVTLHPRRIHIEDDLGISPKESLWLVERVETLSGGEEVEHSEWDDIINIGIGIGSPTKYARHGDYILFDTWVEEDVILRFYLYYFPTLLSSATPSIQTMLPDTWDEVIVLGAMWRAFDKLMEPERSSMAFKQYIEEVVNRQDAYYREDGIVKRQLKARFS